MYSFIFGIAALILGYFLYGKIAERIFVIRPEAETPAVRRNDGVDFVPMSAWKATLIQLLNIAGTGPVFGAIAGALFGPAAFVWIVFGCIFAGAVHDYILGMLSMRNDGANIAEIVGKYLGRKPLIVVRVFSLVLLVFVGAVFVTTPAQVLQTMFAPLPEGERIALFDGHMTNTEIFYLFCIASIISYYILATLLPIDKVIGRIYPVFGACLLTMAAGLTVMMFATGEITKIPEFSFVNLRPDQGSNIAAHLFPFLFITIACGAVSGFHATQSPLMARCLKTEKEGRMVFYGAMILEGIVAMIWAAVTMAHFDVAGKVASVSAPVIVAQSCTEYMGWLGGILAVFGVVACPVTSGDTAFRSARLSIADAMKFDQKPLRNRLAVALPLFAVGVILVLFSLVSIANFNIIWRYFAWANQTLAAVGLWAASAYLAKAGRNYWLTLLPAVWMTAVTATYFFTAGECLGSFVEKTAGRFTYTAGLALGLLFTAVLFAMFMHSAGIRQKNPAEREK
ncbi:MAG: carbon starvation protein A [Planctomycetaceae bacterium]|jgi:carbon starvation protein CstA|nr:carbon starvation protein A [Planctomycetaceae bacterium]